MVSINYAVIKKMTSIDKDTMHRAIENIISEIAQIFQEFYSGNFQLDLEVLGKFFLFDRCVRFQPFLRPKKVAQQKKVTIKNMIDTSMKKQPVENMSQMLESKSQIKSETPEDKIKKGHDVRVVTDHQRSMARSIFSNQTDFVSPIRRTAIPNSFEDKDLNLLFGAGTDPLALNQNFATLAANPLGLIGAVFSKPPYARIRCPPVIDLYSRTLASPVASQYNSLSTSSRIGLFYSPATKYLWFDPDRNEVGYLKIKENKTKLTANEELLKPMATEAEEISFIVDPRRNQHLQEKIDAKLACFKRYREYIESQIPEEIIAPIRQYWITNVLDLISGDQKNLDDSEVVRIVDSLLSEINNDYKISIKKSILDYILLDDSEKLRVGILQRFDEPIEYGEAKPRGIIAGQSWVDKVEIARDDLKKSLVNYNHVTLSIISVWKETSKNLIFDLPKPGDPKLTFNSFHSNQNNKLNQVSSTIKVEWIRLVSKIYQKELGDMEKSQIGKFFDATRILMSSQLREYIYKSLHELCDFIKSFERDHYLTPLECIENDKDRTKPLQKSFLVLRIIPGEDKKIKHQDRPDNIRASFMSMIDHAVQITENIPPPQHSIVRSEANKNLLKIVDKEDEVVNQIRKTVDKILTDNMENIEKVIEIFSPYEYLLSEAERLAVTLKNKLPMKEYERLLTNLRNTETQIEQKIPFEIHMNMVLIDCRDIRSKLLERCKKHIDTILKSVEANMMQLNSTINEENTKMFEIFENAKSSSKTADATVYEECDRKKDLIKNKERARMFANLKELSEMLFFMFKYHYVIGEEKLVPLKATAINVHDIDEKIKKYTEFLNHLKDQIKKDIDTKKIAFDEELKKLKEKLDEVKKYDIVDLEGKAIKGIDALQDYLNSCEEQAAKIQENQGKIGVRKSTFEELEKCANVIQPFKDLWKIVEIAKRDIDRWTKVDPIFKLDAVEIAKSTKIMKSTIDGVLSRLEEMDPRPVEAIDTARDINSEITKFAVKTPLLTALCTKGMEQRHWEMLNEHLEKAGVDMKWGSEVEYKLTHCDENKLIDHVKKVTEISEKAEKEYKNLCILRAMYAGWDNVELKLKSWKEGIYYVIVGDSVDEIQTLLDDHIIQTQTMKGSQFAKIFEAEIAKWEGDLLYLRDSLELWLKVQANWIYLSPIFASPDITKELPAENSKFQNVNNEWKDLMSKTLTQNRAIEVPKDVHLKERLKHMLEKLENIQEKLYGYLNMKRSMFPRFYFLSEDSLIEVLSEAQDATKIQKYCKILFEGIKSLEFDSNDVIVGMKSSEGEYIKFEAQIATKLYQGMVEQWLQLVENQMIEDVRRCVENSHIDFEQMSREECRIR